LPLIRASTFLPVIHCEQDQHILQGSLPELAVPREVLIVVSTAVYV
jgi:hypothetical protein